MQITLTHCKHAPNWETLQTLIKEATGTDGRLVRISRKDGGANYHAPGEYELNYEAGRFPLDLKVAIQLTVLQAE